MQIKTPGTMLELLPIPSGAFLMRSDKQLFWEAPAHEVRFRSGFLLGNCPVTQAPWQAVMAVVSAHGPSELCPGNGKRGSGGCRALGPG